MSTLFEKLGFDKKTSPNGSKDNLIQTAEAPTADLICEAFAEEMYDRKIASLSIPGAETPMNASVKAANPEIPSNDNEKETSLAEYKRIGRLMQRLIQANPPERSIFAKKNGISPDTVRQLDQLSETKSNPDISQDRLRFEVQKLITVYDVYVSGSMSMIDQGLDSARTLIGRRKLLTGVGLAFTGMGAAWVSLKAKPLALLVEAMLARPKLNPLELPKYSQELVQRTYDKYFGEMKQPMSKAAWSDIVVNLSRINQKFARESERTSAASYDSSLEAFIAQCHRTTQELGGDFSLMVSLLQHSGTLNVEDEEYNRDIDQERVRIFVALSENLLGVNVDRHIKAWLTSKQGYQRTILRALSEEDPLTFFEVSKILGPPTLGFNDLELQVSEGVFWDLAGALPDYIEQSFINDYPAEYKALQGVHEARVIAEKSRAALHDKTKSYLEQYGGPDNTIARFTSSNTETSSNAFSEIGVGDQLSFWQKTNNTTTLAKITRLLELSKDEYTRNPKQLEHDTVNQVILHYTNALRNDPTENLLAKSLNDDKAYEARRHLFSEQILNPDFIAFLRKHAASEAEQEVLAEIVTNIDEFEKLSKDVVMKNIIAFTSWGKRELDKDFQVKTALMQLQYLSNKFQSRYGELLPDDLASLAFNVIGTYGLREVPNLSLLADGFLFARNSRIDSPYDHAGFMCYLKVFLDSLHDESGDAVDVKSNPKLLIEIYRRMIDGRTASDLPLSEDSFETAKRVLIRRLKGTGLQTGMAFANRVVR